jgi:hypothetical protein
MPPKVFQRTKSAIFVMESALFIQHVVVNTFTYAYTQASYVVNIYHCTILRHRSVNPMKQIYRKFRSFKKRYLLCWCNVLR